MRSVLVCVAILVAAAPARAEPTLVYAELLGKGGPWGLGVEHRVAPRLGLGAVVSVAVVDDRQLYTVAPYVHVPIARGWFAEVGLAVVHSRVPSPVAGWDGMTDTGAGGIATGGWGHAWRRVEVRAYLAVEAGEGGVAPWLGTLAGVRL